MRNYTTADCERLDHFARTLRTWRNRTGQSQQQLARAAGLSPTYIGLLEAGARCPRIQTLRSLAQSLRPAPIEFLAYGRTRHRGDPDFHADYNADEAAVQRQIFDTLLDAIGESLALPAEVARAIRLKG